jgi:hypothetical protein
MVVSRASDFPLLAKGFAEIVANEGQCPFVSRRKDGFQKAAEQVLLMCPDSQAERNGDNQA